MNTIRSKICGLTRVGDAQATAALGADAIGLVFFAGSKRCVSIEQAQKIVAALPPFVSVVALFVNETADGIRNVLSQVPIDIIQFHGDETPEFCQQFHRPYIKAVRVQNTQDMLNAMREFASARAVLFDAFVAGEYG
ncbi:MAG: phosphoribosylanthranilate isomerase, partial [Neisseria sp.]|nr:phosphoribosylanthranilate isomerase [Neisseria sp.]